MIEFWNSLSYTSKFSAIAFVVTAALGFISMGILGAGLYYPVSFLFKSYPTLNDWRGDWVWPATIGAGMAWSVGFLFGGIAWHYLQDSIHSLAVLRIIYGLILWVWAALTWYLLITNNVEVM